MRACVLLPLVWLALIVAAPATALGAPASALTYALGSLICHQRPDRSFDLFAVQMPVCARCAGLYAGAAIGAVVTIVAGWRWSATLRTSRTVLLAAAIPTAGSWLIEAAGIAAPSSPARAVAALPLGFAVAWVVIGAVRERRPASLGKTPTKYLARTA